MLKSARGYGREQDCLHCRYRKGWLCTLVTCYLEKNNIKNSKINTDEVEIEYDCYTCPYKKHGGCVGYCMAKVIKECKEIWKKNEKWR